MKTIMKIAVLITLFSSQFVAGQNLFEISEEKISVDLNETYSKIISELYVKNPAIAKVGNVDNIDQLQLITFKLNDGTICSASLSEIKYFDNGHYSWIGRPADYKGNGEYIVFDISKVGIRGLIWYQSKMYEVKPLSFPYHVIYEVDQNSTLKDDNYDYYISNSSKINIESLSIPKSIQYYDVLVLYTPAAKIGADPDHLGDPDHIIGIINNAISAANIIYSNSGVQVRINKSYIQEINYTEVSHEIDVNRLAGTNDGYMDNVHTMRTNYGADIVILYKAGGSGAGRAKGIWVNAGSAFAVVKYSSSPDRYTFTHEIGHLFGGEHEIEFDDFEDFPEYYNHGFTNTYPQLTSFQTIMGVKAESATDRVPYFSDPNESILVDNNLRVLGGDTTDNVTLVHNIRAETVAGFYDPPLIVDVTGPTILIGTQGGTKAPQYQATGTWYVSASGGVGNYSYQWQYDGYSGWTDYVGETDTSLTKTLYYNANGHDLRCVVTSGSQTENDEIHVFVTGDIFLKSSPNPFNPITDIEFNIPEESNVRIEVFNIKGQKISSLINSTFNIGKYSVEFDGTNLGSGIYICKMVSESTNTKNISTAIKRLILLK